MALRGDIAFTADWARTLTDPQAFAHEQRCLGHAWTFLGFTGDVAKDGDWFRASLATRSVFVQRFGAELKGFENVCAHRFYPLRTKDKGNGPIVCGFHHWRYDQDGAAIGIPKCQENFGTVSRALGARVNPIVIATCGTLVFGRFPGPASRSSKPCRAPPTSRSRFPVILRPTGSWGSRSPSTTIIRSPSIRPPSASPGTRTAKS